LTLSRITLHGNKIGVEPMLKKGKLDGRLKLFIQGIPLAGVIASSLLPIQRFGQQFLVLIILLWIQIFFIVECFVGK
jgi:hypothetical protein